MDKSVADILAEKQKKAEQGPWHVANDGSERPFMTRTGKKFLYMYQPSTGRHAYYDVNADVFLSDDEASLHLP